MLPPRKIGNDQWIHQGIGMVGGKDHRLIFWDMVFATYFQSTVKKFKTAA